MSAQVEFEGLIEYLHTNYDGVVGQMFGKKCIKVNGKAAVALFKDSLVFKLPEGTHGQAMALSGSILWDPSGKGRPMKEWVQIPFDYHLRWKEFAIESLAYMKS